MARDNTNTARILDFIAAHKADNAGNSPTVREIMAGLGLGMGTISYHLDKLESLGMITRPTRQDIRIPGEAYNVPSWLAAASHAEVKEPTKKIHRIRKIINYEYRDQR